MPQSTGGFLPDQRNGEKRVDCRGGEAIVELCCEPVAVGMACLPRRLLDKCQRIAVLAQRPRVWRIVSLTHSTSAAIIYTFMLLTCHPGTEYDPFDLSVE